jgi:hypothetical protein
MAQAVCYRPLTEEAQVCARFSPCGKLRQAKWHWDRVFFELFAFLPSISFHRGSPCSYIISGMNNTPVGGHSSETLSHPIDMNNN